MPTSSMVGCRLKTDQVMTTNVREFMGLVVVKEQDNVMLSPLAYSYCLWGMVTSMALTPDSTVMDIKTFTYAILGMWLFYIYKDSNL